MTRFHALLAAVLGEGVFDIELAPVAIAADQAGSAAVRADGQADAPLAEIGIAQLVGEPQGEVSYFIYVGMEAVHRLAGRDGQYLIAASP